MSSRQQHAAGPLNPVHVRQKQEFVMNFALRYAGIRTRMGATPALQRPLALTTRPIVYMRLVPDGFPSHVMEIHPRYQSYIHEWPNDQGQGPLESGVAPTRVRIPPYLDAKFITAGRAANNSLHDARARLKMSSQ